MFRTLRRPVRLPAVAALAACLVAPAAPALGLAGDLDRTFGSSGPEYGDNGRAIVTTPGCDETPPLLAKQSTGQIVLATDTCGKTAPGQDMGVSFVSATGDVVNGGFVASVDFGGDDVVNDVDVLADDAIVVSGVSSDPDADPVTGDVAIGKLGANGLPDTTFGGGDGKVTTDVSVYEGGLTLLPQPTGELLVVATSWDEATEDEDLLLLRYTAAGVLDQTFGTAGVVTHEAGHPGHATQDAAGRILVAGRAETQAGAPIVSLQRFTADGAFDETFGTGGTATVAHGAESWGASVTVASDGSLLVGGLTRATAGGKAASLVYRFTAEGQPVGAILDLPSDPYAVRSSVLSILEQPDGKLLALGGGHVARFSIDGTFDRFFGENGVSRLSTGDGYAYSGTAILDGAAHLLAGIGVWDYDNEDEDAGVIRMKLTTPYAPRFFHRMPARIFDTRVQNAPLRGGETRAVAVSDRFGIPATGVSALAVNVTVVAPSANGWLTLYPAEEIRPVASSVNFAAGRTVANHVTVKIRPTTSLGDLWLYSSAGSAHVLLDLAGYYTDGTKAVTGGRFVPVQPQRILDSRPGRLTTDGAEAPIRGGQAINLQVHGRGGLPTTGVAAVVLNLTAVTPTSSGYLTVWPTAQPRPGSSNLNFTPGRTVPNTVTVSLSTDGRVSIFNSAGYTHVLADVAGYYTKAGVPGTSGDFWPLAPKRIHDTRSTSAIAGPGAREIPVLGAGRVPATGVAAVVLNVTVTLPTTSGYLAVYPGGGVRPTVSNLNFTAGQTVANQVIVKVGANGKVAFFNSSGRTHVVVDVAGWITS